MEFNILSGKQALAQTAKGHITVVYAEPKAGKSRFACTAAKKNKVLYIDSELSAGKVFTQLPDYESFADNFHRPSFTSKSGEERPVSLKELLQIMADYKTISQYDVIVIDSLTHVISNETKRIREEKGKSLSYNEWGEIGYQFDEFMAKCQRDGISLLITIHEETKDNDGRIVHFPKTEGNRVAEILKQRADNIFFLRRGEEGYRLFTQGDEEFIAGSRDGIHRHFVSLHNDEIDYTNIEKHFAEIEEEKATAGQKKEVAGLCKETETDEAKLLKYFKTTKTGMSAGEYSKIKSYLLNKLKSKNADSPSKSK